MFSGCVCCVLQEEKIKRVLEFLEKPYQASDKDLAAKVGGTQDRQQLP